MTARIVLFVLSTFGVAFGAWLLKGEWLTAGLIVALLISAVWFGFDLWFGRRLVQVFRHDVSLPKWASGGIWGDVSNRLEQMRKRHNQALKASEAKHQSFLEAIQHSPYGVVMLDANDHIEWCNATVGDHLGLQLPRDEGQLIGNLVRSPLFWQALTSPEGSPSTVVNGIQGDLVHPARIGVHVHSHGAGKKLILTHDVTALEQAEAMRRDFVANVSHEIRTPLTVLSGFVETLQTLPLAEDERQHYLDLMASQADRMRSLVGDLLTLSKLESSPRPDQTTWCSARQLLEDLVRDAKALSNTLHPDAHGPLHRIEGSCVPDSIEWNMSRGEMHSAFANLVSNAVRYTPVGGRVDISFSMESDGRSVFTVKDTGEGIAPEHLPRLTERFYRIDRSRSRETGGTGLGLAIVKHVVQRHDAELRVESELGHGSRFAIVFPTNRVRT